MKKNKCIILLIALLVFGLGGVIWYEYNKVFEWKDLKDVPNYENMLNDQISKISLRKTVDSKNWIEFEDDDLIRVWEQYFETVSVKYCRQISKKDYNINGGIPTIVISTQEQEYVFYLRSVDEKVLVEIDCNLYEFKSEDKIPFYQTYDEAVSRQAK